MFYIYILYSPLIDKYYIGFSADIQLRTYKHNKKHAGFTNQATDWKIVYSETFNNKLDALKREKQIKSWKSRKVIEQLIRSVG